MGFDSMSDKRSVYGGYEEKYMTGAEIFEYFSDAYLTFGRHHEKISSYRIDFKKYYPKIKSNVRYRLFINDYFCKIMDDETDKNIYFFGYTKEKPAWAKD